LRPEPNPLYSAAIWRAAINERGDATVASPGLSSDRGRGVHEPAAAGVFPTEAAELALGALRHLQEESLSEPDIADRASLETDRSLELRTRDRERKLIARIDDALQRIDEGTYGYCEETSEPISLRRLEARPIATLSIEAQERHERMERTHRDD